jgi:hypothetical protein
MTDAGKHHNSALRHIATTLLTRIIACWRAGQSSRAIIAERYAIPKHLRAPRRTTDTARTDRRKLCRRQPSGGPLLRLDQVAVHALVMATVDWASTSDAT